MSRASFILAKSSLNPVACHLISGKICSLQYVDRAQITLIAQSHPATRLQMTSVRCKTFCNSSRRVSFCSTSTWVASVLPSVSRIFVKMQTSFPHVHLKWDHPWSMNFYFKTDVFTSHTANAEARHSPSSDPEHILFLRSRSSLSPSRTPRQARSVVHISSMLRMSRLLGWFLLTATPHPRHCILVLSSVISVFRAHSLRFGRQSLLCNTVNIL